MLPLLSRRYIHFMRLYVVRHGQTSWNIDGRTQGRTDIPLDEVGQLQAKALGSAFRDIPLDRILCSDLLRASQTAAAIGEATGLTPLPLEELRERSFGVWEGGPFTDIIPKTQEISEATGIPILKVRPKNGESIEDVWNRLDGVIRLIEEAEDRLAIVAHGGSGSVLLARLVLGSLETVRSFRLPNTSVTELERRPEGFYCMVRYADTSHLAQSNLAPAHVREAAGASVRG